MTMFTCDRLDSKTGEACAHKTKRKWNLLRHIEDKHTEKLRDAFIGYVPGGGGALQKISWLPVSVGGVEESTIEEAGAPSVDATSNVTTKPQPLSMQPESLIDITNTSQLSYKPTSNGIRESQPSSVPFIASDDTIFPQNSPDAIRSDEGAQTQQQLRALGPGAERRHRQRKRLCESLEKGGLPEYQVKRSKKWPLQQPAIEWITQSGKAHFDHYLGSLLAKWRVSETHKGTCLLWPSDWAALDPLRLAEIFDAGKCPLAWAEGVSYKQGDHTTSLTRAIAWFRGWPRNGLDLNNFLGAGPFKQKHGSHTCHKHLCLIHVVYESAEENEDRKQCHARAKFLRQEGLPIPQYCDKHQVGCLMQHAALTLFEAFLIQFWRFRQAKGLPPILPPSRPRWHVYPTFEYELPLRLAQELPAVVLDPHEVTAESPTLEPSTRPELVCRFCDRIKSFKGPIALWSHFVHQHTHKDPSNPIYSKTIVERDHLLEEIRRTAKLWRVYWSETSDGGKRRDPTMIKIIEVSKEAFTWETVLGWELR